MESWWILDGSRRTMSTPAIKFMTANAAHKYTGLAGGESVWADEGMNVEMNGVVTEGNRLGVNISALTTVPSRTRPPKAK